MFEHFTERARKVMALANSEAQRFNHTYIGTEHILLGLVKEDSGVGAHVLKNHGVDLRKVRLEVEKLVKHGPDTVNISKLPQTPRARIALEFAIEEAHALNHQIVGTEHLLLGLLRENDGVGGQILANLRFKIEDVREEIRNLIGFDTEAESPEETKTENEKSRSLEEIGQDLLKIAAELKRLGHTVESAVLTCIATHLIQSQG